MTHSPASAPDWKDWLAALRHTLGIAARYRDKTPKNPARAIHTCRARVKEARALLRLAPPSLREQAKACRKELAAAARILSAPRDSFVVAATLKELIKAELSHPSMRTLPTRLLRGTAGRSREQHRVRLQQTSREVEQVRVRIATWSVPTDPIQTLINLAEKSWRRARKLIPDPLETATEEQMHEFRKAIIICRYQTVFFRKQYRDGATNVELALDILRKKLGKINDLYRLEAELLRPSTKCGNETLKSIQSQIHKNLKKIKMEIKISIKKLE